MHEICDRFNSRVNHDSVVQTCFDKAKDVDRSGLLASKPSSRTDSELVLATTFSPLSYDIKQVVLKSLIGHYFQAPPIFAHKHAKNVRDILVKSDDIFFLLLTFLGVIFLALIVPSVVP